jgi:hypothetical protein
MREIEKIDGDIVNDIRVAARPSENGRREPIILLKGQVNKGKKDMKKIKREKLEKQ